MSDTERCLECDGRGPILDGRVGRAGRTERPTIFAWRIATGFALASFLALPAYAGDLKLTIKGVRSRCSEGHIIHAPRRRPITSRSGTSEPGFSAAISPGYVHKADSTRMSASGQNPPA